MKLLVISQHFWPESFRINEFVETIGEAGVEVSVLTGQPNYPDGVTFPGYKWHRSSVERHPGGYDLYRVPLVPRGRGGAVRLFLNYISFILFGIIWGTRCLRGKRFDVLFVYGTSPILQAYVAFWLRLVKGGRVVLWVQDLWPHVLAGTGYIRNRFLLRLVERFVAQLYRRSDLILTQSEAFIPLVQPLAGNTPVQYLPNPGELPRSAGAPAVSLPEKFNIVFAGNLGKAQALRTVAEAAALLGDESDIHITLFGSGSMEREIGAEIARLRLGNLTLGGRVAPETMPSIYSQCAAALVTLIDDPMVASTVPSKLQTYLGAGVPIIAAAGAESARIVRKSGAGLVCAPENAEALADAIRAMKILPEPDRVAMRAAGRAYFREHFEPHMLAHRLIRLLGGLTSAEPGKDD